MPRSAIHRPVALLSAVLSVQLLVAAACAQAPATAPVDGSVTIYQCTDAAGARALRSSPCAKGEQQQVRTMVRPTDAPASRTRTRPAPVPPAAAPPVQTVVVVRQPPRPLYECVQPDGGRYTSDTADGAPRFVPLWTLGYPVAPRQLALGDRIGAPAPRPPADGPGLTPPGFGGGALLAYPVAGTWLRDACHALPPAEACARLRDRREAVRRRFFNAMPSEREVLGLEERGINARLADDCGGN